MIDTKMIESFVKENKYKKIASSKNPRAIILGELHGKAKILSQQERLIEKLRPEYLLHEIIGVRTYDPKSHSVGLLKNRLIDDYEYKIEDMKIVPDEIEPYLVQWAEKYGYSIVGCDLSCAEVYNLYKQILARKHPEIQPNAEESEIESLDKLLAGDRCEENPYNNDEIVPYRDRQMGKMIAEYAGKTQKPLIAIVGADHIRPKSPIHQILKNSGIEYIAINQSVNVERPRAKQPKDGEAIFKI